MVRLTGSEKEDCLYWCFYTCIWGVGWWWLVGVGDSENGGNDCPMLKLQRPVTSTAQPQHSHSKSQQATAQRGHRGPSLLTGVRSGPTRAGSPG